MFLTGCLTLEQRPSWRKQRPTEVLMREMGFRSKSEWGVQCEYCWDKECSRMGEDEQGSSRGGDGGCRRPGI